MLQLDKITNKERYDEYPFHDLGNYYWISNKVLPIYKNGELVKVITKGGIFDFVELIDELEIVVLATTYMEVALPLREFCELFSPARKVEVKKHEWWDD